jgi:hypothetical protein
MRMTRLVDSSMAGDSSSSCVQFYTVCNGLQYHMDMAVAGNFWKQVAFEALVAAVTR